MATVEILKCNACSQSYWFQPCHISHLKMQMAWETNIKTALKMRWIAKEHVYCIFVFGTLSKKWWVMSFHRQGFFNQYKLKYSIKQTLHTSPNFCLVLSSREGFHILNLSPKSIYHLFGKYRAFSIAVQKHDIGPTLDFSELVECDSHNGRPFFIYINQYA